MLSPGLKLETGRSDPNPMEYSTKTHFHPAGQNPVIIIHRAPTFPPLFIDRLTPHFSLIDPISVTGAGDNLAGVLNYLRRHGSGALALLCVETTPLGKETLDCLPSLECVVLTCAGVDHVDLSECRRRGIAVANIADAFSDDVADFAVGLLIDVMRKISFFDRSVRAGFRPELGQWEYPLGSILRGKRVGIVGLGSIGSRVAKRLSSFGCSIAYNSRRKKPSISFPYYNNVYDLALNSNILIICCSLTDQTHHLINKDVLMALGKDGVSINVGRGALVDEKELIQFLVEHKLGGAGLDVFEDEPNVPKELLGLDNVVLSPHNAVNTPENFKAAEDIVVANFEAFFSGKPLHTPIRWE